MDNVFDFREQRVRLPRTNAPEFRVFAHCDEPGIQVADGSKSKANLKGGSKK